MLIQGCQSAQQARRAWYDAIALADIHVGDPDTSCTSLRPLVFGGQILMTPAGLP